MLILKVLYISLYIISGISGVLTLACTFTAAWWSFNSVPATPAIYAALLCAAACVTTGCLGDAFHTASEGDE